MTAAPRPQRWIGLDALRGLTIASMILVNNPGRWGEAWQYPPLRHADWHGCTFTDLVFPAFLFVAGAAIVPAFAGRLQAGTSPAALRRRIARRVVVLCLLGLLLAAFPLVTFAQGQDLLSPLWRARLPGVLQRIGICYGIAALLYLTTTARTQRLLLLGCLLLYWPLITLVPVPGVGAPDLAGPTTTLPAFVDRLVFGQRIWVPGSHDPEGILSTIPALATCLFGVAAGRVLAGGAGPDQVRELLLRGALLTAAGAVWGWFLPFNKPLWTSSYAVFTAGIATTGLGLCCWFGDVRGLRRLVHPLQVYGQNALLVFVASGLLGRIVGSLWTVTVDGRRVPVKDWFFDSVLLPCCEPRLASLLFALLWVVGWYAVLAALHRRQVILKV